MGKNFYTVIIGTELLNGRREDSHFSFVNKELLERGYEQKASFVITDKPEFMEDVYTLIKKDPESVMFSFGGIGATPDDYTREVAAKIFTGKETATHQEALERIKNQFKEEAYPHRIKMAELPLGADLIDNPVNNVPGFSLENRFFFVPGFPQMAHPMVKSVLNSYFQSRPQKLRKTITVKATENSLMDLMEKIPKEVELSSLPTLPKKGKKSTVFSLSCQEQSLLNKWFDYTVKSLDDLAIEYEEGER